MISAYIIMSIIAVLVVVFSVGLACFVQSIRTEAICDSSKTDYPKSMVALSESKILELPTRKNNYPLCKFKNGKKVEYAKKEEN